MSSPPIENIGDEGTSLSTIDLETLDNLWLLPVSQSLITPFPGEDDAVFCREQETSSSAAPGVDSRLQEDRDAPDNSNIMPQARGSIPITQSKEGKDDNYVNPGIHLEAAISNTFLQYGITPRLLKDDNLRGISSSSSVLPGGNSALFLETDISKYSRENNSLSGPPQVSNHLHLMRVVQEKSSNSLPTTSHEFPDERDIFMSAVTADESNIDDIDQELKRINKLTRSESDELDKGCSSSAKKQDHNAKERLRRIKLHSSYLTLGALLPHSPPSKNKWSAPVVMDRVLGYIPELEKEIEQLTLRKKQIILGAAQESQDVEPQALTCTVSVHEVRKSEVIIQISMRKDTKNTFSSILHYIEAQGINIVSASTVQVCDDQRICCYHLHVQMDRNSCGVDYITVLRDKGKEKIAKRQTINGSMKFLSCSKSETDA